jgi:hypothetical protein
MNGGNRVGDDVERGGGRGVGQPFSDAVERLLDQSGGPATRGRERAFELLRAASPYVETQDDKERVGVALSATRARGVPRLLGPVTLAGVLLGFGAVASATIWHWPDWIVQTVQLLAAAPAPAPSPSSPSPVRRDHRLSRTQRSLGAPDLSAVAEPDVTWRPEERDLSRDSSLGGVSRGENLGRVRIRRVSPVTAGEDTGPVLAAMRALRRDHDPVRARILLTDYLQQHPGGTLAEEALAMSIEAAVAHQDADIVSLAKNYLRLYPSGPFRGFASRTLAGSH